MSDEKLYWLAFSFFPGVGTVKFGKLLTYFGSAKKAWEGSERDLKKILGEALSSQLFKFRTQLDPKAYAKKVKDLGVDVLLLNDADYPKALLRIKNPPFVLYVKGKFNLNAHRMFGIVGTRKITEYGRVVTELFGSELSQAGFTIVSGLAAGVDSASHRAALEAGGLTVAVLGCGVDCCTPPSNEPLYNSIVKNYGCIVSEIPVGFGPIKGSFPQRNRIIAGLSEAVLVTEGAEDSGALITADYAFKFNRAVFAVPGPITSQLSKGPYKLIQKGAKLVVQPKDILDELKFETRSTKSEANPNVQKRKFKTEDRQEQKILELLENEGLHFDELIKRTKMSSQKLGSLLSLMEVKGMVKSSGNGTFSVLEF